VTEFNKEFSDRQPSQGVEVFQIFRCTLKMGVEPVPENLVKFHTLTRVSSPEYFIKWRWVCLGFTKIKIELQVPYEQQYFVIARLYRKILLGHISNLVM